MSAISSQPFSADAYSDFCASSNIVLTTINAKYAHTSFGLRYLRANLHELREQSTICEFHLAQRSIDMIEKLAALKPKIIGLGVYIWNTQASYELVQLIRAVLPQTVIVLGGPEVSYEYENQPICMLADYVVLGEGEVAFYELCQKILNKEPVPEKFIRGPMPSIENLILPYREYTDEDVQQRFVYVEASRGCAYQCEFCLSSLDQKVRRIPLESFLNEMQRLFDRGVRNFKFIDRTFNLHIQTTTAIVEFFLERYTPDLFLHFEMVPDRLPDALRALIARFPKGSLQFEIGIQSFDEQVGKNISRRQDIAKLEDNLHFLNEKTGVHLHTDLIVGLPGEDIPTFARGLNKLYAMGPQEIQIGILKRLKGTPIIRHDREFQMVYSPLPPFEILYNKDISFELMQAMKRFARYWDMIVNSGKFPNTLQLLLRMHQTFEDFFEFSQWFHATTQQTHAVSLDRLAEYLLRYLLEQRKLDEQLCKQTIAKDYMATDGRRLPGFLQDQEHHIKERKLNHRFTKRQKQHQAHQESIGPNV